MPSGNCEADPRGALFALSATLFEILKHLKIRTLKLEDIPSNRAEVYEGETVRFTFDAVRYNY